MATRCPSCGAQLKDDAPRFCASCGHSLGGPGRAESAPAGEEKLLFHGSPATVGSAGALLVVILTVGLAWLWLWVRARATDYRITTRRIVIERGIFSKRLEQIDLYRVVDYVVERPFGQRLLGTGNLLIETTDRTTREVRIERIRADVRELYEKLRAATEADKRSRNVRVVDIEQ